MSATGSGPKSAGAGAPNDGALLKRWLADNGCYLTAASTRGGGGGRRDRNMVETHLLMDGGRLHVPDALGSRFLAAYAESVLAGEWLYVVEQRTEPTFRLFCDFDYRTPQRLDDEGSARLALRLGAIFQKDVFSTYVEGIGPEESKAMVTYCPCCEEKPGCFKVGVHFNWRCDATLARAKVLRQLAVRRFSRLDADELGFALPSIGWGDVIDSSVYDRCGLRLLHSRKNAPCPACKGRPFVHVKPAPPAPGTTAAAAPPAPTPASRAGSLQRNLAPRRSNAGDGGAPTVSVSRALSPARQLSYVDSVVVCPTCQGRGRVDCGRLYKVATVLDARGERDDELGARCATDIPFGVRWSSIRGGSSLGPPAKPAPVLTLRACPEVAELTPDAEEEARRALAAGPYRYCGAGGGGGNAVIGVLDGGDAGDGGEPIDGYMEDVTLDPRGLALAKFLRENEPGAPEAISVKMYNGRAGKVPGVTKFYVAHTSCHYCQNKGGEHQSSKVYFVATPAGVTQRCFSQKGVVYERSQTTCSNYRSDLLPWLNAVELRDQLFGDYCRRCAGRLDRELRGEPQRTRAKRTKTAGDGDDDVGRPAVKRTRRHARPRAASAPLQRALAALPTRQASPPFGRAPTPGPYSQDQSQSQSQSQTLDATQTSNEFEDMLNGLDSGSFRLNGMAT